MYDEFVSKVVAKTSQLRQGMDAEHDYSCEVGSMTTAQQLAIVSGHVDDAVSKGARVLVGGKSSDPSHRGTVLPADSAGRCRPRDEVHEGGDLRAHLAGDEGP